VLEIGWRARRPRRRSGQGGLLPWPSPPGSPRRSSGRSAPSPLAPSRGWSPRACPADAGGVERFARVVGDGVVVGDQPGAVQALRGRLALDPLLVRSISRAPRGPRSVLWVVVEMTCAWPTGEGCTPPITSPATCAMSATRMAPTSPATSANPGGVDGARDRGATAEDQLGPLAHSQVPDLVQIDDAGVAPHAILHRVEPFSGDGHVPAVVRWPPIGSAMPITVSPGSQYAR
jgi:hypothetical protein